MAGEKTRSLVGGNYFFSLVMGAVIAMILSVGAIGVASVSSNGSAAPASDKAVTVVATMTEFGISFSPSVVPPGPVVIDAYNSGSVEHNIAGLAIDKRTPNVPAQQHVLLEVGKLSSDVEFICEIPGHKESGMVATLKVQEGAEVVESAPMDEMNGMTNEQMDAAMEAVAKQFPAKTKGTGNEELKPTIAADGAKVFDLVAKIVEWEVEPGKMVQGWTYNGQIPGPILRANVGDKVRINLKNELPQSTSMHLHGVRVPNSMDGVDPYTQPATKPGESFVYEFVAKEPAIGMYHSHHNAQIQIPNGMAGALIIGDWKDIGWKAAGGRLRDDSDGKIDQEVVMVLNDAGNIGLSLNGKSFPATSPYTAKLGETMLVHYYNEGMMSHPMHMHQPHGLVVARDGKPLDYPYWTDTVSIAPGERWTVAYTMIDPGVWAWHCHILSHAETPQGMKYMVTAVIVS